MGPGLLESIYDKSFKRKIEKRGFEFQSQMYAPVIYKGLQLDTELRLDFLIEDLIVVELKAIDFIHPVHEAQ